MGKPTWSHVQVLPAEYIGRVEGTTGSETSQYRQEKIFREYWREKADQAKPRSCDTRQGLRSVGLWDHLVHAAAWTQSKKLMV